MRFRIQAPVTFSASAYVWRGAFTIDAIGIADRLADRVKLSRSGIPEEGLIVYRALNNNFG